MCGQVKQCSKSSFTRHSSVLTLQWHFLPAARSTYRMLWHPIWDLREYLPYRNVCPGGMCAQTVGCAYTHQNALTKSVLCPRRTARVWACIMAVVLYLHSVVCLDHNRHVVPCCHELYLHKGILFILWEVFICLMRRPTHTWGINQWPQIVSALEQWNSSMNCRSYFIVLVLHIHRSNDCIIFWFSFRVINLRRMALL